MIDLHTHSTCSDGTETPAEVVASAKRAGLDIVGLTDHDTTDGWAEARSAAEKIGIGLVRGAEFTTRFAGISVHLLGYLFDPDHPAIAEHLGSLKERRIERAREITRRLGEDFPISWTDVVRHVSPGATVGRPHIADALAELGIVPDRSAAFTELLSNRSPYYVEQQAPNTAEVIGWVNDAGGRAVLAHPLAVSRGYALDFDHIEELAGYGLCGIEVHHRDNPASSRGELAALVGRLGLAEFGSSDYHGSGKPNALGENITEPSVYQSLIRETYLEV